MTGLKLFSGNANPELAAKVATLMNLPLGKATVDRFSDGEIFVEILENVRGKDIFILQSTCTPTDSNLMELVLMADALRRASAGSITAVIPYFGYARQDRRVRSARVPISAKVVADMIASVGIERILTVDLHADQIQGFFYMPVDNAYASSVILEDVKASGYEGSLVVSPDVGGVVRARAFAKYLPDGELAILDKRRAKPNEAKIMHIIGDVAGRDCIIVDDIVDTAGTLLNAAVALKEHGATRVVAYCTHAVLSGHALENISRSSLDELVVTDTIPLSSKAQQCGKIRQLSLAPMLAEAIRRIHQEESITSMFF
jgi:ribose-phosphate pyrophosphokinase